MNAKNLVSSDDLSYLIQTRRYLHQHPEIGFELAHTTALVRDHLANIGIISSESYGTSSLAAYIGAKDAKTTVALRADMDALPITEKTGLPYASVNPGFMHACGHDAHTAILLTVAQVLKRAEPHLPCRVKLLFQPSEECEISGAKMMAEHGAMDDVDMVLCTHVDNDLAAGTIGICPGDYMAACNPITITFRGKTAHATLPAQGIDAVAMAWEAYGALKQIAADEAMQKDSYIFSINYFHGGTAHNVISDQCQLKISFRYYNMEFATRVKEKCIAECKRIAAQFGGDVEINWYMSAPPVHNNQEISTQFCRSVSQILPGQVCSIAPRMSTEDFSWFLQKRPGILFRIGTRNAEKGCTTLSHCNDFQIDEDGLKNAVYAFVQFVLDQQAG